MKNIILSILLVFSIQFLFAQEEFTIVKEIAHTSVKNQQHAGTCWSFATVSFIESELLRINSKEYDLSELFFVYHAYIMKVENYIRLRGKANLSQGGQAHEVFIIIDKYGAMPESAYSGYAPGDTIYNHTEMESILIAMTKVWTKNKKPGKYWNKAVRSILDVYMGQMPNDFKYKNKNYTANSFKKKHVNISSSDYIQLTSFTHQPFYKPFRLEIPDNWIGYQYYNIPLNELMEVMDYAIDQGYSVCWDGDVSEKQFKYKKGYARLDEEAPKPNQKTRQELFDNFISTDDHLMHLIGTSKDEEAKPYYIIKNSWGESSNDFEGLLHMSKDYAMLKTIAILVHKDAIPKKIKEKLAL